MRKLAAATRLNGRSVDELSIFKYWRRCGSRALHLNSGSTPASINHATIRPPVFVSCGPNDQESHLDDHKITREIRGAC